MSIWRNKEDEEDGIIHRIRYEGSLWKLADRFIKAYEARTQILQQQSVEIVLIGNRLENIQGIVFEIEGKVDTMSSNIDRIEKEAADLAEDVAQVRTVVEGLNGNISELKGVVADLQAQVAAGQVDQARLDAAASKLEKVDDDLDAITLPGSPNPEPAPEG